MCSHPRVLASPPFRCTAAALRSRGRAGVFGGAVTPGARATRARRAAYRRPRRRRLCAGSRRRARRSPSTCAPRRATPFSSRRGCGTAAGPTARVRTGGCTTASTRAAPSEGRRPSASRCGPGRGTRLTLDISTIHIYSGNLDIYWCVGVDALFHPHTRGGMLHAPRQRCSKIEISWRRATSVSR